MPTFQFTSPEGKQYEIGAPEGATKEQAFSMLQSHLKKGGAPTKKAVDKSVDVTTEPSKMFGTGTMAQRALNATVGDTLNALSRTNEQAITGARQVGLSAGRDIANLVGAPETAQRFANANNLAMQRQKQLEPTANTPTLNKIVAGVLDPVNAVTALLPISKVGQGARLIGKGGTIAKNVAKGVGAGVGLGTIAPVTREGQRQENQAIMGAVGGAVPAALGTVKAITNAKSGVGRFAANRLGIDPQKVQTITDAGLEPNIAAVGSNTAKRLQNTLAVVPISSGVIQKSAQRTMDAIDKQVQGAISTIGKPTTIEAAGEAVQTGTKKSLDRFKDIASKKYQAFDNLMPVDKIFNINNTLQSILENGKDLTPALQDAFENTKIKPIIAALVTDAPNGKLPFKTIKAVRSRIGEMLTDTSLVTDLPRAELKRMYGALSTDLQEAAASQSPQALKRFQNANDFYAQNIKRVDRYLERVNTASKSAEQAFKAIESGAKDGGSILRNTLLGVPKEESSIIKSTILERLGKVDNGSDFNSTRFLTGMKKLSPEAKAELFKTRPDVLYNLNKISKAVDVLSSTKQFENFSRSGEQAITAGLAGGIGSQLLGNLFSGNIVGLAGTAAKIAGGGQVLKLSARAMQSPRLTKWLAELAQKKSQPQVSVHLQRLADIARQEPNVAIDAQRILQSAAFAIGAQSKE